MEIKLSSEEARVLGCLVEKEFATPQYYPPSVNALVAACNQKSARDPVMELELDDVAAALEELRHYGLALQSAETARVPRFGHNLRGKLHLDDDQAAILCELLLRGPQTPGELRGRASRLRPFPDVEAVERVLEGLAQREPALVAKLSRRLGFREHRYTQLLSDDAPTEEVAPAAAPAAAAAAAATPAPATAAVAAPAPAPELPAGERIARLEQDVASLREEVADLRRDLQSQRLRRG